MEDKSTCQGVLCFGGSFNPIHNAHLECCRKVAQLRGMHAGAADRSSSVPPHKAGHSDMAAAARSADNVSYCCVDGDPLFRVSDIELRRAGPSYTIDTIRELRAQGHLHIHWLIGADMLAILPKWHRARELIREATILAMARPGFEFRWDQLPAEFQLLRANVVDRSTDRHQRHGHSPAGEGRGADRSSGAPGVATTSKSLGSTAECRFSHQHL